MNRPPFDRHVAEALEDLGEAELAREHNPTIDQVEAYRAMERDRWGEEAVLDYGFPLEQSEHVVPGHDGADLAVTVFRRAGSTTRGPAIFHIHSGGMVVGNRFVGLSEFLPWIAAHDAVVATVEYRLAPEFRDPVPVEDCYQALLWFSNNAASLGADAERLVVAGISAGGGLAAGTALLARDRGGPVLAGLMMACPMLDDRDRTASSQQFKSVGAWHGGSNRMGWRALLGDRVGGPDVSAYAAPARASNLAGLPPTFLDVGSAEVFRDEVVAFAAQLWADGGVAELHVWPGGTHGWEWIAPGTVMAAQASEARATWFARLLQDSET